MENKLLMRSFNRACVMATVSSDIDENKFHSSRTVMRCGGGLPARPFCIECKPGADRVVRREYRFRSVGVSGDAL